ncbi:hypothetical protein PUN28_013636 [Cardiocondyla obscurior]|uniref:Uncharacterized protein n=1 Tax=Cardiocondyla obscurior TaxID=286306 RepID=A0AAW2F6C3_9HYME
MSFSIIVLFIPRQTLSHQIYIFFSAQHHSLFFITFLIQVARRCEPKTIYECTGWSSRLGQYYVFSVDDSLREEERGPQWVPLDPSHFLLKKKKLIPFFFYLIFARIKLTENAGIFTTTYFESTR